MHPPRPGTSWTLGLGPRAFATPTPTEIENFHKLEGGGDTFYIGNMKGVGRIHQQTFVDTYSKVTFAKLYDRKTPITAAEILNDRVIPFFESQDIKLQRVLTGS